MSIKVPSLVTDLNQACFTKMSTCELQEEVYTFPKNWSNVYLRFGPGLVINAIFQRKIFLQVYHN